MGLKQVKVGSSTRVVRISTIPGSQKRGGWLKRVPWVVAALLIVSLALSLTISTVQSEIDKRESSLIDRTAGYSSSAVQAISRLYDVAEVGGSTREVTQSSSVSLADQQLFGELVDRVRDGRAARWEVSDIAFNSPSAQPKWDSGLGYVDVQVRVDEYQKDTNAVVASYTYLMRVQYGIVTIESSTGS